MNELELECVSSSVLLHFLSRTLSISLSLCLLKSLDDSSCHVNVRATATVLTGPYMDTFPFLVFRS